MWPYPNADVVDIKEGDTVSIRPVNKASGVFAKTIVSDRHETHRASFTGP
jgi:hypothetical protein